MLTKFNNFKDINSFISDTIHSYIKDGYTIDMKESVIDKEKDGDCTFKSVLKRDVDGIECKAVITLHEKDNTQGKSFTFHKVDSVGDTKWGEETRTFESSCNIYSPKDNHVHRDDTSKTTENTHNKKFYVKDTHNTKSKQDTKQDEDDSKWVIDNFDRLKRILTKNRCDCSWINKYTPQTKQVDSKCNNCTCTHKQNTPYTEDNYDEDSLVKLIRYLFGC